MPLILIIISMIYAIIDTPLIHYAIAFIDAIIDTIISPHYSLMPLLITPLLMMILIIDYYAYTLLLIITPLRHCHFRHYADYAIILRHY